LAVKPVGGVSVVTQESRLRPAGLFRFRSKRPGRINLYETWTRPSNPALDTRPRSGNVRPGPV